MFVFLLVNLDSQEIIEIRGDNYLVENNNYNDLINNLNFYLHDKRNNGKLKGGFWLNIQDIEYRAVYVIKDNLCEIVMVNQSVDFEDPNEAQIDRLTGLEKKHSFLNEINKLLLEEKKFQIFIIDIDHFRNINDLFGENGCDMIIKDFVNRILLNVVSNYSLFRYNGDTFGILREGRNENKFIDNLRDVLDEPFIINGKSVYLTLSIGSINVEDTNGITPEELVDRVNIALNHAKASGKNNWVVYKETLKNQSIMELEMEVMIRDALKNDQFELHYQPQFSLSENKILGAEALIRWVHPEKGSISPSVFIPIAEKSGLVVQIGEWVIKEVCKQQRMWIDLGISPVKIAVNIGSLHFKKPTFVEDIKYNLEKYNLQPELLGLEITEGSVITDVDDMIKKLNYLRNMGISVSIDDFGTGYSSLSYLKKFPIDTLKIDQSFILNISTDSDNVAIVKAIISLAKHLNLNVIAEGVETESARDLLRKMECFDMQGYLFSKPINNREFMDLISIEHLNNELS